MNVRFTTAIIPGLFILSYFFLQSCKSSHTDIAPTNLQLATDISTDGSGIVKFKATADNARYFKFTFGDDNLAAPFKSLTGDGDHTYDKSGNYDVIVTAHTNEELFITFKTTITVSLQLPIPQTGYTSATSYPGMTLLKAEEFSSAAVNEADWTFEIGDGCPNCGWGNNELEYYTNQNAFIQDGYLVIKAKIENKGGKGYTSARMITRDKFSFTYGRIDVRAILPKGQGLWPAIWMLGSNINTVGWPTCGEIDIMEMIGGGGRENTVYGTAHWNEGGHKSNGGSKTLDQGLYSDGFHVYSLEWSATEISWLIDDVKYYSMPMTSSTTAFNNSFFLILNVAVGGAWPGNPDTTTKFPQYMMVDYIRIFQQ